MRQVAQSADFAVSTVSKALRNDPTIPEARCREIQALAKRLGYRPNPMVATLMAQLHNRRRCNDPHHIAWIDLWPSPCDKDVAMGAAPVLMGARERAQEMGYGIEVYPVARDQMSPERLRRVLTSRGQWGMIIPPVPESAMGYPLDLRGLAAVTIGTSLHESALHRVSPNHFQGCALAFEQLGAKGFSRIGLVLSPAMNKRVEGKWLGAFLASQHRLPMTHRVAALIAERDDSQTLARWLRRERPDAVLAAEVFAWRQAIHLNRDQARAPAIGWLMKQKTPRGLGYLDYRPEQLGRVAVEMVVAQIHRNERSKPTVPQTVLIDAVWRDS
jgi:LacI family transcriptional regulator